MNVLSLFDGMSCGQLALKRANVSVDNYFACEIDKYAMQIANKNFPNTIQLGDVSEVIVPNIVDQEDRFTYGWFALSRIQFCRRTVSI